MNDIIKYASSGDDWAVSALEESPDQILRALAKAWYHAQYIPQNLQQYRACILLPAIKSRMKELEEKKA